MRKAKTENLIKYVVGENFGAMLPGQKFIRIHPLDQLHNFCSAYWHKVN